MKKIYLLLAVLGINMNLNSQVFTLVDSVKLSTANIWGVLSDDGDSLCATTTQTPSIKPHIFMRKINYGNISQQSSLVQLTFDLDFTSISNLTDHKSIILNNELYVAFSTQGDQDLFLFKTDINGNRIGSIVSVVTGSPDPTNDMILVTDSIYIYVLHFDPPFQHHVYKYDTNLNPIGSPFSTTTLNHNNIGNALFKNNEFHMFTGNNFGFNANLIYTKWNNTWSPVTSQNIINASGGDGNWFSTGVMFDTLNQRWYIAMNHIYSSQTIGQEHIDLLAFDISLNQLERLHVTSTNYTRPHFVLKGGYLYMSYDQPGVGVYLHKYLVQNTTGISFNSDLINEVSIYPNPFSTHATLCMSAKCAIPQGGTDNPLHNATLTMFNCFGQIVAQFVIRNSSSFVISRGDLPRGLYFVRLTQEDKTLATEKLIITY